MNGPVQTFVNPVNSRMGSKEHMNSLGSRWNSPMDDGGHLEEGGGGLKRELLAVEDNLAGKPKDDGSSGSNGRSTSPAKQDSKNAGKKSSKK